MFCAQTMRLGMVVRTVQTARLSKHPDKWLINLRSIYSKFISPFMLLQQTIPVKLPTFSATVLSSAPIRASKFSRFVLVRLINIRRVHVVFAVKLCSAKRRRNVRVRECVSRVFRQRRIWWNVRRRLIGLIALTEPISGVVCRLKKVSTFLICLLKHGKSV